MTKAAAPVAPAKRRRRREDAQPPGMFPPAVVVAFAASAAFLLSFHVAAENFSASSSASSAPAPPSFYDRLRAGPDALLPMDLVFFGCLTLLALDLLNYLVQHSGQWFRFPLIPVRGKHLDELTRKDLLFIGISKAQAPPFLYLYLRCGYHDPNVLWSGPPTVANAILPLVPIFVIYDFFYTALHWFLHLKSVYPYVHKHHHVQKAPSRANVDAINVHPLEFFLGEYNHLLALWLCCRCVCQVHVVGSLLFLVVGAVLAGINHTRYDVTLGYGDFLLFDSKAHDVHHRIPQSNYGQYIMLWDVVFGTFRPYNPKDRINADAQLDPATGTSIAFVKAQKAETAAAHSNGDDSSR